MKVHLYHQYIARKTPNESAVTAGLQFFNRIICTIVASWKLLLQNINEMWNKYKKYMRIMYGGDIYIYFFFRSVLLTKFTSERYYFVNENWRYARLRKWQIFWNSLAGCIPGESRKGLKLRVSWKPSTARQRRFFPRCQIYLCLYLLFEREREGERKGTRQHCNAQKHYGISLKRTIFRGIHDHICNSTIREG